MNSAVADARQDEQDANESAKHYIPLDHEQPHAAGPRGGRDDGDYDTAYQGKRATLRLTRTEQRAFNHTRGPGLVTGSTATGPGASA